MNPNSRFFWVQVAGSIGGKGWSALAEGIQLHPGLVGCFRAPKEVIEEATRNDLRKVWDALFQYGVWGVTFEGRPMEYLHRSRPEAGWLKMEQLLDTN